MTTQNEIQCKLWNKHENLTASLNIVNTTRQLPTQIRFSSRKYSLLRHKKTRDTKHDDKNNKNVLTKLQMSTPSPATYNLPINPSNMTTAPAYTMRPKTYPEKGGGDRVSWGKEWFATNDRWTIRANFGNKNKWPSPSDYEVSSTIGRPLITYRTFPSHSIGKRKEFTLVSKADARNFPSPNFYDRSRSQNAVMSKSPSFSIQPGRRQGTLPFLMKTEHSPGPGHYNPKFFKCSSKVQGPAFTIAKSLR